MASTPEGKVKKKIRAFLDAQGVYRFSPIGGAYSAQGVLDEACCVRGQFLAIEVKAPGRENRVTALQQHNIEKIRSAGGVAIVASSVEQVKALFEEKGWIKNEHSKTNADVAC